MSVVGVFVSSGRSFEETKLRDNRLVGIWARRRTGAQPRVVAPAPGRVSPGEPRRGRRFGHRLSGILSDPSVLVCHATGASLLGLRLWRPFFRSRSKLASTVSVRFLGLLGGGWWSGLVLSSLLLACREPFEAYDRLRA